MNESAQTTDCDSAPFVDTDEMLNNSFRTADEVSAQARKATTIDTERIISAIKGMSIAARGLARDQRLTIFKTLVPLVAKIDDEGLRVVEAELTTLLGNDDAKWFMEQVPAPVGSPAFYPYSFSDLLNLPPKDWLIDQILGAGDMGMIYGPPGCGKTFVIIDMIMAACTGKQWALRFNVRRHLNIAYCAGEGISGLPGRFAAAAHHHGITDLANFTFFKTVPQLYNDGDSIETVTIRQFIREWKKRQEDGDAKPLDLLIIDTLHAASTAADENSAKDMGKVLHACRWASQELGCAVLLVHHSNKAGTGERGSSSLRGAMDFMIEIKSTSDSHTKALMCCEKQKEGERWKDQTFDLTAIDGFDSVRVWWDEPSDLNEFTGQKAEDKALILAAMQRFAGTKFTAKSLSEVITKSDNYTRKLVSELEKAGECQRTLSDPNKGQSPRNPWVYFVEAMQSQKS